MKVYIQIFLIVLVIFGNSEKTTDKYIKTQNQIKRVESKIIEVNHKINEISIIVDSLGFVKNY